MKEDVDRLCQPPEGVDKPLEAVELTFVKGSSKWDLVLTAQCIQLDVKAETI